MRLVGLFLMLISNVTFAQSSDNTIVCATPGVKIKLAANRISSSPEKLRVDELNSAQKDSSRSNQKDQNNLIIGMPFCNVIYSGYDNLIHLGFSSKNIKRYTLECDGCDTLYRAENGAEHEWIIRASIADEIVLRVMNKRGNTITTSAIPVIQPPLPTVYLDGFNAQSLLTSIPEQIRVKYDPAIPLSTQFRIKRWSVSINNGYPYTGFGTAITKELSDIIQSEQNGTIAIAIMCTGPNGDQMLREIFRFELN